MYLPDRIDDSIVGESEPVHAVISDQLRGDSYGSEKMRLSLLHRVLRIGSISPGFDFLPESKQHKRDHDCAYKCYRTSEASQQSQVLILRSQRQHREDDEKNVQHKIQNMFRRVLSMLLISAMILANAAMADTYNSPGKDLRFEYDERLFKITTEDCTDDEQLINLDFLDASWGKGYVSIYLRKLENGESVPTLTSFAEVEKTLHTTVEQGACYGFKDAFHYTTEQDGAIESAIIVPICNEDNAASAILTVNVSISRLEDEETGRIRDDAISSVINSLKIGKDA